MLSAEMIGSVITGAEPGRASSDEAGLVARLRRGEQQAYEQLVEQQGPLIYRVAFRLLGDAEEAREVTQETFIKVFRYIDRLRGDTGLSSWMFRIAMNQAANHRRWWKRHRRTETVSLTSPGLDGAQDWNERIADTSRSPEENLIALECRRSLLRALGRIVARFRIALILRDLEGFSYGEISHLLSISLGTVKSRIARGRAQLKVEMEKEGWTYPSDSPGSPAQPSYSAPDQMRVAR